MQAGSLRLRGMNVGSAVGAKIFPAMGAGEIGVWRRFGHEHCAGCEIFKLCGLADGAPEVVFDHQEFGCGMGEEVQLFGGGEFVIERH